MPNLQERQELKVSERDNTVTPHQLRTAGYIPATVYGEGVPSQNVQVKAHDFYQFYLQGKRNFQLSGFVSGSATLKQFSRNPVTQKPIAIELCLNSGK